MKKARNAQAEELHQHNVAERQLKEELKLYLEKTNNFMDKTQELIEKTTRSLDELVQLKKMQIYA